VTLQENDVSIVLPVEGYANVVRLVTGGFLSRCEFDFEAIDDIQLALDLALRWLPVDGTRVTVRLVADRAGLTIWFGALVAASAERALTDVVRDGLELGTVLGRLVDRIELVDGGAPALILRKAHEAVTG